MQKIEEDLKNSKTLSARILIRDQKKIWKEWEKRVREAIPAAAGLDHPILLNTLPIYLVHLAEALAQESEPIAATQNSNIPSAHGSIRARLTNFKPEQLVQEYQILRSTLCRVLAEEIQVTERDARIIHTTIDQSIREAVAAYFLVHANIREQFVASLTHDLRQPLNVIKMSAELISNSPEGERAKLASQIQNAVQRADRMVQDLLDSIALEFGEALQVKIRETQIMDLLRDAVKEWNEDQRKRLVIIADPCTGYWDPDALNRALFNLISNAFKYGLPERPVTIRTNCEDGRLSVSVHNEGKPIPSSEREVLFQPFRRASTALASGKKGWGIGLSLIRAVAEAHGGSVIIESSKDSGTTFAMNILQDARKTAKDSKKPFGAKPEPY